MPSSDLKKLLDKLAHDIRGRVHNARLNLEAAQMLAKKDGGPQQERLLKHLSLISGELEKLQEQVKDFTTNFK
jgi:hypothetical protein